MLYLSVMLYLSIPLYLSGTRFPSGAAGLGVVQQGLQQRQHLLRAVGALCQRCQLSL